MAKTYNDIYIAARRTLRDAGIEAFGMEARLIVSSAAGKTVSQLMRDLPLYAAAGLDGTVRDIAEASDMLWLSLPEKKVCKHILCHYRLNA